MNRKGGISITAGTIITLVIVLITAFIIMGWLSSTGKSLDKEGERNACKLTLSLQESTRVGVGDHFYVDSPFKLQCKRRFIEIRQDEAVINLGIRDTRLATYDRPTDGVVAKIVADSLANCWDLALEGKKPIFNDRGFVASRSTICLICDQIDMQASGSYLGGSKLPQYLAATMMPGRDITYDEYLFTPVPVEIDEEGEQTYSSGQRDCMARNQIPNDVTIERGTYATIAYRDFGKFRDSCMGAYIVPAEQLGALCDYVAN